MVKSQNVNQLEGDKCVPGRAYDFLLLVAGDGDVMVFLHMQKTGGTFFGKNLVKNLRLKVPCQCSKGDGMLRCPCMSEDHQRWAIALVLVG